MCALNDYAAVLFDMDGTLLDSTACVEGIWRRWAARRSIDADHLMQHVHGLRTAETIARVAPHLDIETEVAELEAEVERLRATITEQAVALHLHEGKARWD